MEQNSWIFLWTNVVKVGRAGERLEVIVISVQMVG
jgi:hypothetical protein